MVNVILRECMKRGFLLDREMLDMISSLNEEGAQGIIHAISRIGLKEKVVTRKVFTENFETIQKQLLNFSGDDILLKFFSALGFIDKKKKGVVVDEDLRCDKNGKVRLLSVPEFPQRKVSVSDFVRHFKSRYEKIQSVLEKQEFPDLSSIRRIGQGQGNYTIIAAVVEKRITKNKNMMIKVEDMTGTVSVLVNQGNLELYNKANNLLLDDIVAFSVSGNSDLLFVAEIIFPEAYLDEKRYGEDDCWVAFTSDLHIGSKMFLEKNFLKFVKWLNCGEGTDEHKKIAKNVRYLFMAGDIIDGHAPGQEPYLKIKTTVGQYKRVEEIMKLIRKDLQVIMCPGRHDAVWVGEPQPIISERWASGLHKISNLHLVPNPSLIEIDSKFKILMYHGASINNFINELPEIRTTVGHSSPTTVVKEMVRRSHLAPTHGSADYIPCEEDPLVIDPVPDIIFTGDQHRSEITTFNNILLVAGSCWQSITPFEEKTGNIPEPCRVPLFNLKTREVKVLDFSSEDALLSVPDIIEEHLVVEEMDGADQNKRRMKIGIDIDDTLVHTCKGIIDFYNKKYGRDLKYEENEPDKRFHEFLGITKEELIKLYGEYDSSDFVHEMEAVSGASEVLKKIKQNHDISLITARPDSSVEDIMFLLNKHYSEHNFDIHFLNFSNSKKVSKGEFCKQNGFELMIDDDHKNAFSCVENGVDVILLNRPWNKGIEHDKVFRADNWEEVEKIIEGMASGK